MQGLSHERHQAQAFATFFLCRLRTPSSLLFLSCREYARREIFQPQVKQYQVGSNLAAAQLRGYAKKEEPFISGAEKSGGAIYHLGDSWCRSGAVSGLRDWPHQFIEHYSRKKRTWNRRESVS